MDMEMWKNFPRPPCGIALVKNSLRPSLENSGSSFCCRNVTVNDHYCHTSTIITVSWILSRRCSPPTVAFRHSLCSVEFHNYWIIIPAGALECVRSRSGRISPSNTKNIKTITTYIRMWIIMMMQCICNSASEPSGLFLQEPHDLLFMLLQSISCGHFLPLVKNRLEKLIRKKQYQLKHDTVGNMIRQTTSNVPDYSKLLSLTNTDMAQPVIFFSRRPCLGGGS